MFSKFFLALAGRLDFRPALSQLSFLLFLLSQGGLLPPLLLILLQLSLPDLLLQRLEASVCCLTLLRKIILLRASSFPAPSSVSEIAI